MAWNDGNVNGVANASIGSVSGVARSNDIKFVNNVDGGNVLVVRQGSVSGTPELVYTSVSPSSSIANGDIVYEDVSLDSTYDGGDDTYFWNDPNCTSPAFIASADIDPDGEVSNRACVAAASWVVGDITGPAQTQVLASSGNFFGDTQSASSLYVTVNGLKMFIAETVYSGGSNIGSKIKEYTLATANDITSTITYVNESLILQDGSSGAVTFLQWTFNTSGFKAYAFKQTSSGGTLYEYNVVGSSPFTAKDISNVPVASLSFTSKPNLVFAFNRSGTTLYTTFRTSLGVTSNQTYTLSTAWDLSTASANSAVVVTSVVGQGGISNVYMYESVGNYDHLINFAQTAPKIVDFRNGITTSDVNSTTGTTVISPNLPTNLTCINDNFIFRVSRSGSSTPYTFTLQKYLTNV